MKFGMVQTKDRFSPLAGALRREFDAKFQNPHQAESTRFVWDFWHIPNEYTVLRTPAYHYFSAKLYNRFHRDLVEWGRMNLGCHDVSPPWLSCYVSGCRQEKHVDRPHGPLAFVFSLTKWGSRRFSGGETFLQSGRSSQDWIEPKFNRLTLFNPSVPHGVREVKGCLDPRYGRLVIHGWFVNPRPFWVGPLQATEVQDGLDLGLESVVDASLNLGGGLLSLRLAIAADGAVESQRVLVNTLVGASPGDVRELGKRLKQIRFPRHRRGTVLTLPLICETKKG